ncbi:MAG TPA: molybdopterin-dependent oxidoreductase, partial [Acidimicrobiales bacterium]|nr:molybdopterin-dependent oxidoreductase [Acidimicrobiales bacterium]
PQRAGAATGLDPAEVEALARAYGEGQPAFIRTLIGAEHHEHGARFFRTLGCLPLVTGSWRHLGGGLARSTAQWNDGVVDESVFDAPQPTRSFPAARLGAALTEGHPDGGPPVHALFVWCSNPILSLPNAAAVQRGLARADLFTVVSEQFLTDTARYADVVLPAATQLEQLDVVPAWGHLFLGWNEPAIEPRGEAVPNTELWRRLAGAFGLTDPRFALDDEALIRLAVTGVDVDELRRTGFVRLPHPDPLLPYAEGGFATPSGKAELWAGDLYESAARVPAHLVAEEGPTLEAAAGGAYPLSLLTPKVHQRFLNTTYSDHHGAREGGGPWVELDPVDAAARGLAEGDLARVANGRGHLDLPLRISARLRPGVALVPWGWWGEDRAANVLTSDRPTDWGGGAAYLDTRVEVTSLPS